MKDVTESSGSVPKIWLTQNFIKHGTLNPPIPRIQAINSPTQKPPPKTVHRLNFALLSLRKCAFIFHPQTRRHSHGNSYRLDYRYTAGIATNRFCAGWRWFVECGAELDWGDLRWLGDWNRFHTNDVGLRGLGEDLCFYDCVSVSVSVSNWTLSYKSAIGKLNPILDRVIISPAV